MSSQSINFHHVNLNNVFYPRALSIQLGEADKNKCNAASLAAYRQTLFEKYCTDAPEPLILSVLWTHQLMAQHS